MNRKSIEEPQAYEPSAYPSFAVTVDVVILTLLDGELQVLLVKRSEDPFSGAWATPGGFKLPTETLDAAAHRELAEETGVDSASLLVQFGAYGDPGRDPRMNVVSIAYLAVMRTVDDIIAGSDAAAAAMFPVRKVLRGRMKLAFDHRRILADAVERVRTDLETTGLATAFIGQTFTLKELRSVYEGVWEVSLDAANFRRRLLADGGWVVPTGRLAPPGAEGGKPPELFKAGTQFKHGAPLKRRAATR